MKREDLQGLYKEFYFHELDVREKLETRFQIGFAIYVTVLTIIAYMLKMVDSSVAKELLYAFYLCLVVSLIPLSYSIYLNIRGFWGHKYLAVASPVEIEKYRKETIEHEKKICAYNSELADRDRIDYNAEEELFSYLYGEYARCTTYNIDVNYKRGVYIHTAIKYLLFSVTPLVVCSLVFILGDLDGSSPRKAVLIKHSDPLVISHDLQRVESLLLGIKDNCMLKDKNTEHGKVQTPSSPGEMPVTEVPIVIPTPVTPKPPEAPIAPEPRDIIESHIPENTLTEDN